MIINLPTKRISAISQWKTLLRVLPTRWLASKLRHCHPMYSFSYRISYRVQFMSMLMGLLQLRYEHDSSTIRLRFERDTTSYEELCAFEQ